MEDVSDEKEKKSEYTGNIKTLYQGLLSEKPEVQFNSVQELRKIISIENNPPIDEIIDIGCISLFVKLLKDFTRPKIQYEIVTSGAVNSLIEILIKSTDKDVIEQSIWCLGNIAAGLIVDISNIFTTITKITILRNATWCLSNLCRGKPSPSFKVIVIPALRTIDNIISGRVHQTDIFIQYGGVPVLTKVLQHTKKNVRKEAARTISIISDGERANSKIVKNNESSVATEALLAISNAIGGSNYDQIQYMHFTQKSRIHAVICKGLETIFTQDSKYAQIFKSVGGVNILKELDFNNKALELLKKHYGRK
eukprot:gene6571-10734_t